MKHKRILSLIVIALLASTGLSACGGNDVSGLSTTKLLARAKTEVKKADYVSISGKITEGGAETGLDLNYAKTDSTGEITVKGAQMEIESVGGTTYFRPSAAFWKAQMGAQANAVIKRVGDKWIVADANDPSFKSLVDLASRTFVTDQILKPSGTIKKGKEKKVNGVDCIALNTADGTLYLDKSNARPVEIAGKDTSSSGTATFSYEKFDAPKAPAKADTLTLADLQKP